MSETAVDTAPAAPPRSAADQAMCRLLCIPAERRARATEDDADRIFSVSMVLSGLRCLLSYIVLPILLPLLGLTTGVGPIVGLPVGIVALYFDVKGIRRFWLANHRHRWPISVIYAAVMAMVLSLVVLDVLALV